MNYQPGMIVTPNVQVDDYGNEVLVDFDIEQPRGFDSRYSNDYSEDSYGNVRHVFQDVELGDDDDTGSWDPEIYDEEVADSLTSLVGGWDNYYQMTGFLAQVLDESEINAFDELVDRAGETNDYGELEEAVQRLYQFYLENAGQYQQQHYYDEDDEYDEYFEPQYSPTAVTVFEAVGGQDYYNAMTTWAAQYLDDDVIDAYDRVMERDDPDEISEAVGWLYETFIENT